MTYTGKVTAQDLENPVEFMLVFSGINIEGEIIIFDYLKETLNPVSDTKYEFLITYHFPSDAELLPEIEPPAIEYPSVPTFTELSLILERENS